MDPQGVPVEEEARRLGREQRAAAGLLAAARVEDVTRSAGFRLYL